MHYFVAFVTTLGCVLASVPTPYHSGFHAHVAYSHGGRLAYPPAQVIVLPNGHIADTPEVAHAKSAHYIAKEHQAVVAAANPDYDAYTYNRAAYEPSTYAHGAQKYSAFGYVSSPLEGSAYGSSAYPRVLGGAHANVYAYTSSPAAVFPHAPLVDTPEVVQAKEVHYLALADASSGHAYANRASTPYAYRAYH